MKAGKTRLLTPDGEGTLQGKETARGVFRYVVELDKPHRVLQLTRLCYWPHEVQKIVKPL